ncbi:hypothetical protein QOK74_08285 [Staphylococcus saprophyticus]|uniref:hypothetical protein n=1 Tax=Staphylococcus saprophyticus TaxID=29385 RepID=UPI0024C32362|nr:hypothetical protein [Staphylococcus saprophyticus]MDK1672869.1 hypothetical protein [Staphylococcus saprophyticus]
MTDFKRLIEWAKHNKMNYNLVSSNDKKSELLYIKNYDAYIYNDENCPTNLFNLNDVVRFQDNTNFEYNNIYELENDEQMKMNTDYKIIDIDIFEENEILYTLKNITKNVICGVMVNSWEIEKVR